MSNKTIYYSFASHCLLNFFLISAKLNKSKDKIFQCRMHFDVTMTAAAHNFL